MSASPTENKVLMIVLAILLGPVAVGLVRGIGPHFFINLALYILSFGILGAVHALYIVLKE